MVHSVRADTKAETSSADVWTETVKINTTKIDTGLKAEKLMQPDDHPGVLTGSWLNCSTTCCGRGMIMRYGTWDKRHETWI